MIKGIGVDLVETKRFTSVKDKEEFLRQILSNKEILNTPKGFKKDYFYAEIFAIKEAILKALAYGFCCGSGWHKIAITKKVEARLSGIIKRFAQEKPVSKIHITKACSKKYTTAFVLIE